MREIAERVLVNEGASSDSPGWPDPDVVALARAYLEAEKTLRTTQSIANDPHMGLAAKVAHIDIHVAAFLAEHEPVTPKEAE